MLVGSMWQINHDFITNASGSSSTTGFSSNKVVFDPIRWDVQTTVTEFLHAGAGHFGAEYRGPCRPGQCVGLARWFGDHRNPAFEIASGIDPPPDNRCSPIALGIAGHVRRLNQCPPIHASDSEINKFALDRPRI